MKSYIVDNEWILPLYTDHFIAEVATKVRFGCMLEFVAIFLRAALIGAGLESAQAHFHFADRSRAQYRFPHLSNEE